MPANDDVYNVSSYSNRRRYRPTLRQILLLIVAGFVLVRIAGGLSESMQGSPEERAAQYPIQPGPTARQDAIDLYQQARNIAEPCDVAGGLRAIAQKSEDPISIFTQAKREDSACIHVNTSLKELVIPETLGRRVALTFAKALSQCETAYLSQWSVAHALEDALKSGGQVEDLAALRENTSLAQLTAPMCYASLADAAAPLGVTRQDIHALPASLDNIFQSDGTPLQQDIAPRPRSSSPRVQMLLNQWDRLNDECQGGYHSPSDPVCAARNGTEAQLTHEGWCYGGPDDTAATRVWEPCTEAGM
ncbi:hypothetical protein [Novosphingobium sp. 9]|uniref:hypothetical protein n=1 Tax=Novosphingobium sp. 9 TaxID=2025349 RepID=UPI0021B5782E|nr:hypothetical protein [Novosphingobium sp. 9]